MSDKENSGRRQVFLSHLNERIQTTHIYADLNFLSINMISQILEHKKLDGNEACFN